MVSKPRISEIPARSGPTFGTAVTARAQPQFALSNRPLRHPRPGGLTRSTRTFGLRLGLSQSNRLHLDTLARSSSDGGGSVRPPVNYWPWPDVAEDETFASIVSGRRDAGVPARASRALAAPAPVEPPPKTDSKIDALRRLVMGPKAAPAVPVGVVAAGLPSPSSPSSSQVPPVVRRAVHRGLPLTPRRYGTTWAGPRTSPGGMATGAAPQLTTSVAPDRFDTTGTPDTLPSIARSGVSDTNPTDPGATVRAAAPAPGARQQPRDAGTIRVGPAPRGPATGADPRTARSVPTSTWPSDMPNSPSARADVVGHPAAAGRLATPAPAVPVLQRAVNASIAAGSAVARTADPVARTSVAAADRLSTRARLGADSGASPVAQTTPTERRAGGADLTGGTPTGDRVRIGPTMTTSLARADVVAPMSAITRPALVAFESAVRDSLPVMRSSSPIVSADPSIIPPRLALDSLATDVAGGLSVGHVSGAVTGARATSVATMARSTTDRAHVLRRSPAARASENTRTQATGLPGLLPLASQPGSLGLAAQSWPVASRRERSTSLFGIGAATLASSGAQRSTVRRSPDGQIVQVRGAALTNPTDPSGSVLAGSPDAVFGTRPIAMTAASDSRTNAVGVESPTSLPDVRANELRANDVGANDVGANDVRANDVVPFDVESLPVRAAGVIVDDIDRPLQTTVQPAATPLRRAVDAPAVVLQRSPSLDDSSLPDVRADDELVGAGQRSAPARRALAEPMQRALSGFDQVESIAAEAAVMPPTARLGDTIAEAGHTTPSTIARSLAGETASGDAANGGTVRPRPTPAVTAPDPVAARATPAAGRHGRPSANPPVEQRWVSARPGTFFADQAGHSWPIRRSILSSRAIVATSSAGTDVGTDAGHVIAPDALAPGIQRIAVADLAALHQRRADVERGGDTPPADSPVAFDRPDRAVRPLPRLDLRRADGDASADRSTDDRTTNDRTTNERTTNDRTGRVDRASSLDRRTESTTADPTASRVHPAVDRAGMPAARSDDTPRRPLPDTASLAVAPAVVQRSNDESPSTPIEPDGTVHARRTRAAERDIVRRRELLGTTSPGAPDAGMPPRAKPSDLADRFLTELSRHRHERPRPLPTQFQSIADVIVAGRTPMISTGQASQRALAAVDKVAATTGDVIHLAQAPGAMTAAAMNEIIAHELTHVAAPSPAPRFFDDDRHSAEERRATEMGNLMRRSPMLPNIAASGASIAGPAGSTVGTGSASGSASAAGVMRQTAGTLGRTVAPSSDSTSVLRRAMVDSPPAPSTTTTASSTSTGTKTSTGSGGSMPTQSDNAPIDPDEFTKLLRSNFDLIVELLEDRIVSELERRGGRFRGDF